MMNSMEVEIRKFAEGDSIARVAKYLHLTDKYIYPDIFPDHDDPRWISMVEKALNTPDSIFCQKNIIIATIDKKIVGAACVALCGRKYHFDGMGYNHDSLISVQKSYFEPLFEEITSFEGTAIVNICVDKNYRSKRIGSRLMKYISVNYPKPIMLDVIADNKPAVMLYKKMGYGVTKSYFGYGGYGNKDLGCLQMVLKTP